LDVDSEEQSGRLVTVPATSSNGRRAGRMSNAKTSDPNDYIQGCLKKLSYKAVASSRKHMAFAAQVQSLEHRPEFPKLSAGESRLLEALGAAWSEHDQISMQDAALPCIATFHSYGGALRSLRLVDWGLGHRDKCLRPQPAHLVVTPKCRFSGLTRRKP
jgi:hypothetical protein